MLYAGRLTLVLAAVAATAVALPNHLKAVVTDKEPVPQGSGVATSFGPFSAKAGVGEGGLYAAADSPLGNAGAGVGSGGLGASASTGGGLGASAGGVGGGLGASAGGVGGGHPTQHKPGHQQPGLFDGIFNIPISVLQAVNQYLNNRGPITKPVHRRRGHEPPVYKTVTPEQSGAAAGAEATADSKVGAEAESHSSSSSSSSSSGGSGHPVSSGHPVMINKRVNYDDIFAIPISALKSVNQLLNGKK